MSYSVDDLSSFPEGASDFPSRLRDALPYILYVFDLRTGATIYQNRSWGRELGYSAEQIEQMQGRLLEHVLHPEDLARLPGLVARWHDVVDGEVLEVEYRMRRADGQWGIFKAHDTVFERDPAGEPVRIVGTTLDITETRSLEQRLRQSQKLEAVGRLAAGVAHDFNNILTGMLGYIDLARRDIDAPRELEQHFEELEKASLRAAGLTSQLLTFARQRPTTPEVIDVNEQIRDTAKFLQRLIGDDIALTLDLSPEVYPVRLDRTDLTQILLNLVVNARDAMPRGGRLMISTSVEIAALPADDSGFLRQATKISVRDEGEGMPEDVRNQIFEPFFTTKAAGAGTGLGLANVYGIVHQAGGSLSVHTKLGAGTEFQIHLPKAVLGSGSLDRPAASSEGTSAETGLILLVEDDPFVGRVLHAALRRAGYGVRFATDGAQALEVAKSEAASIALVIADMVLPSVSGIEVVQELRARNPSVRVLFTSDPAGAEQPLDATLGDAELLAKPFTPRALLQRVEACLTDVDHTKRETSPP